MPLGLSSQGSRREDALDEREMVEDSIEMRAPIALRCPTRVTRAALRRTMDAVCRGHLVVVRSTIVDPVLGAP